MGSNLCASEARHRLAGRRILELGGGTGVLGISLAALGAEVVITDLRGELEVMYVFRYAYRKTQNDQGLSLGTILA
jgi:predicted RNA methylase